MFAALQRRLAARDLGNARSTRPTPAMMNWRAGYVRSFVGLFDAVPKPGVEHDQQMPQEPRRVRTPCVPIGIRLRKVVHMARNYGVVSSKHRSRSKDGARVELARRVNAGTHGVRTLRCSNALGHGGHRGHRGNTEMLYQRRLCVCNSLCDLGDLGGKKRIRSARWLATFVGGERG